MLYFFLDPNAGKLPQLENVLSLASTLNHIFLAGKSSVTACGANITEPATQCNARFRASLTVLVIVNAQQQTSINKKPRC